MREVKFRGKRLDNGSWVYGYYFTEKTGGNDRHFIIEVEHLTIGQYTGLKDVNGREIYEGDIVFLLKVDKGRGDIAVCVFEAPNYYFKGKKGVYNIAPGPCPDCYKVIGNIYENKELLIKKEG